MTKVIDEYCFACDENFPCSCSDAQGYSDEGIVCPHCGYREEDLDSWMYTEDEDEMCCSSCEKMFVYSAYVSTTWSTRKME